MSQLLFHLTVLASLGGQAFAQETSELEAYEPCTLQGIVVSHADAVAGLVIPIRIRGTYVGACTFFDVDVTVADEEPQSWRIFEHASDGTLDTTIVAEASEGGTLPLQISARGDGLESVHTESVVAVGDGGTLDVWVENTSEGILVSAVVESVDASDLVCASTCVSDDRVSYDAAAAPTQDGLAELMLPACDHPTVVACRAYGPKTDTGALGILTDESVTVDPDMVEEIAAAAPLGTMLDILKGGATTTFIDGLGASPTAPLGGRLTEALLHTTGTGSGTLEVPLGPTADVTLEDLFNGAVPGMDGTSEEESSNDTTRALPFGEGTMPDLPNLSGAERFGVVVGPAWNNFLSGLSRPRGRPQARSNGAEAAGIWDVLTGAVEVVNDGLKFVKSGASQAATFFTEYAKAVYGGISNTSRGCHNMAGGAQEKCEKATDETAKEAAKEDNPGVWCSKVHSRVTYAKSCERKANKLKKEQESAKDSCKEDPNSDLCKAASTKMCSPEDPECDDSGHGGTLPTGSMEIPTIKITGLVCGPDSRTTEEGCKKYDAVSPSIAYQTICKRNAQIDARCQSIAKINIKAAPNPGYVDPVDPDVE